MKLARTAHILCQRAPGALTGAAVSCLLAVHQAPTATPAPDSLSVCTAWGDMEPATPEVCFSLTPCWLTQNGSCLAPTE